MVKEKVIFWILVTVIFSTFSASTSVFADGDIPLYFEELTPITFSVVEEAAKYHINLTMKKLFLLQEKGCSPGWKPHNNDVSEVMFIPVYDLLENEIAYYVLGYCGKGEMATFEEILTDIKPLVMQFKESPGVKFLFEDELPGKEKLEKNAEDKKREWAEQEEKWRIWDETYDEEFKNSYMHCDVFPYLESGFGPVNTSVGDPIFGYWLTFDKLNIEYPGEKIEFKHFTYYEGKIFQEFTVDGREILINYFRKGFPHFRIKEKSTLTYTTIFGYTRQCILDDRKDFWNLFLINSKESPEEYEERLLNMFKSDLKLEKNNGEEEGKGKGDMSGYLQDYYYRWDYGCVFATAADLLAWEAAQSHLYNTEFDDYSGDPIFTYIDYLWGNDEWWTVWRGWSDFDYHDWANNWLFQHDGYGG